MVVFTVGHGVLDATAFAALIADAGIEEIVDIRAQPGSRHNPPFGAAAMGRWLPETGIAYTWVPELGGRRTPSAGSPHLALQDPALRAYADHMQTAEFRTGISHLLEGGGPRAAMCSEGDWKRCHRRLLADHLALVTGTEVRHLLHDGRIERHHPSTAARLGDGCAVYDVGATPPLLGP